MPIGPTARLEKLQHSFSALPGEPMLVSELDGYLAGILICPTLIMPSEWLPAVWDPENASDGASIFDTEQQAYDITKHVMAHYNAIAEALQAGRGRYEPVFEIDSQNDDILWEIWIEGFARAMKLHPSSWASIAQSDEITRAALGGVGALVAIADRTCGLPEADIDELTNLAPDLIPGWVDDLHARRVNTPFAPVMPGPVKSTKTGRNDLCPCGSGRKYKKCCGSN